MTEINPDDLFLVPELGDDQDDDNDKHEGPPVGYPGDDEELGE